MEGLENESNREIPSVGQPADCPPERGDVWVEGSEKTPPALLCASDHNHKYIRANNQAGNLEIRDAKKEETKENASQGAGGKTLGGNLEGTQLESDSHINMPPSDNLDGVDPSPDSNDPDGRLLDGNNEEDGKQEQQETLEPIAIDEPNLPPTTYAPKGAKQRKPRSRKVLDFFARKAVKESQTNQTPHMPPGGQGDKEWLKSILPIPKPGSWWETPADDRGFKLKLKWRSSGKKLPYIFHRLGKKELEFLMEKSYDEQCTIVTKRLYGELFDKGRSDIAIRLTPNIREYQVAGGEN